MNPIVRMRDIPECRRTAFARLPQAQARHAGTRGRAGHGPQLWLRARQRQGSFLPEVWGVGCLRNTAEAGKGHNAEQLGSPAGHHAPHHLSRVLVGSCMWLTSPETPSTITRELHAPRTLLAQQNSPSKAAGRTGTWPVKGSRDGSPPASLLVCVMLPSAFPQRI